MASEDALRRAHYENYKTVHRALVQSERATKQAIRRGNAAMVEALTLNQMLLVTIKAEARLMKLLYLPQGFTALERARIVAEQTTYDKWLAALELGYRNGFKIKPNEDIAHKVNHDNYARYQSILQVFENQLKPMITMRNKLAHGQWARPLNSENTSVESEYCKIIKTENCLTLMQRDKAIEAIANILGDLIESPAAYEKGFNHHYRAVQLLTSPDRIDYPTWLATLKRTHEAGLRHLAANIARIDAARQ